MLIVLDQAEELLTRTAPGEREEFFDLLDRALTDASPIWVLATVRSEFLGGSSDERKIAELIDDPLVIEPLSRPRLPEVIERPAQRAGIQFAPGLVQRMIEDTFGGDALPLLAYTLQQLYVMRGSTDDQITLEDYAAVGGVIGVLRRRADRVLAELSRRGQGELALPTLIKLATIEGDGEPTARRVRRTAMSLEENAIVDAFLGARLLKVERSGEEATVEVTHEALLRQWTPLRDALERSRQSIRLRAAIEREAQEWEHAERNDSYLLRGARLLPAAPLSEDARSDLGALEREFIDASQAAGQRELRAARQSARRFRRVASVALGLLAVAVAVGVFALLQRKNAIAETHVAQSQLLATKQRAPPIPNSRAC